MQIIVNFCHIQYTYPKRFNFNYSNYCFYICKNKSKKLYFKILKMNSYYTDDVVLNIIYNIQAKILRFIYYFERSIRKGRIMKIVFYSPVLNHTCISHSLTLAYTYIV